MLAENGQLARRLLSMKQQLTPQDCLSLLQNFIMKTYECNILRIFLSRKNENFIGKNFDIFSENEKIKITLEK